jgi:hypothetical protein
MDAKPSNWTLRSGRSDPWVAAFIFGREDPKKVERQFDSGDRHARCCHRRISELRWPREPAVHREVSLNVLPLLPQTANFEPNCAQFWMLRGPHGTSIPLVPEER